MEIRLITIGRRANARKHAPAEDLLSLYSQRIGRFCPCTIENYPTEDKFLNAIDRDGRHGNAQRFGGSLILLDTGGRSFSSESFARWLQRQRDRGTRGLVFAVGPADGWLEESRRRAAMVLSLGPMTLPHELAAVVAAEQIYRAFTILEGHPYHTGH